MRLIVTRGSEREERQLRDVAEVRGCLRELFGVEFEDSVSLAMLVNRAADVASAAPSSAT